MQTFELRNLHHVDLSGLSEFGRAGYHSQGHVEFYPT